MLLTIQQVVNADGYLMANSLGGTGFSCFRMALNSLGIFSYLRVSFS